MVELPIISALETEKASCPLKLVYTEMAFLATEIIKALCTRWKILINMDRQGGNLLKGTEVIAGRARLESRVPDLDSPFLSLENVLFKKKSAYFLSAHLPTKI